MNYQSEITVVVPTSPIRAHPSIEVILPTLLSMHQQIPDADILVMADGVRVEQLDRRPAYDSYLKNLTHYARNFPGITPFIAKHHQHQANLMRIALRHVRTPTVLFVEHDTPLTGEIPWAEMTQTIMEGEADLIRLHHETNVLAPHEHLMVDRDPQTINGIPMRRTVQWSQRPHLASTAFYRRIIKENFRRGSRTMIEDKMHSVVQTAWQDRGIEGWQDYKLWLYTPPGDIKRTLNLDGRGDDEKYEMKY